MLQKLKTTYILRYRRNVNKIKYYTYKNKKDEKINDNI